MAIIKEYISAYLLRLWYPKPSRNNWRLFHKLPYIVLYPLSLIYYLILKVRKYFFDNGIIDSYRASVPVIIVGNITVGGSGKTPVTIAIIDILKQLGLKPGIIIRGYNNIHESNETIIVSDKSNYQDVGDEAVLLYNRTKAPIAVGPNRVLSVQKLVKAHGCNIIVSDDGLQHYNLQRDIEICLIDCDRLFGNGKLLPAGPLREPLSRLKHVNFLLGKETNRQAQNSIKKHENIFSSFTIIPKRIASLNGDQHSIEEFVKCNNNHDSLVLSGIANNNSFHNTIKLIGINNAQFLGLSDHFDFKGYNIHYLLDKHKTIICTEKDAVKLNVLLEKKYKDNIYYLEIDAQTSEEFNDAFIRTINKIVSLYKLPVTNKFKNREKTQEKIC